MPRRQQGPHTWDNVVAACSRCNLHKAGRTPAEANMKLHRLPTAPQPNPYRILENRTILEEWRQYIPGKPPTATTLRTPGRPTVKWRRWPSPTDAPPPARRGMSPN